MLSQRFLKSVRILCIYAKTTFARMFHNLFNFNFNSFENNRIPNTLFVSVINRAEILARIEVSLIPQRFEEIVPVVLFY